MHDHIALRHRNFRHRKKITDGKGNYDAHHQQQSFQPSRIYFSKDDATRYQSGRDHRADQSLRRMAQPQKCNAYRGQNKVPCTSLLYNLRRGIQKNGQDRSSHERHTHFMLMKWHHHSGTTDQKNGKKSREPAVSGSKTNQQQVRNERSSDPADNRSKMLNGQRIELPKRGYIQKTSEVQVPRRASKRMNGSIVGMFPLSYVDRKYSSAKLLEEICHHISVPVGVYFSDQSGTKKRQHRSYRKEKND